MRYAILSDIHSNLEALEKATGYLSDKQIEKYVVLGDTVGYGANPNECFDWAVKNAGIYILGNHELAVIKPEIREWFSEFAFEAIVWTAEVMTEKLKKEIKPLPYLKIADKMTFAHGSPDKPEEFHYVFNYEDAKPSFRQIQHDICFIGHTHVPCCFCEARQSVEHLKPGILHLKKGDRYILNPGSVGQPRDQDPRLSFGIYDSEKLTFEIVRLPYDNEKAADKIRKAGLPAYLADRLL